MKWYMLKKYLFSILFLIVVFGFSGWNFWNNYEPLQEYVMGQVEKIEEGEPFSTEMVTGLDSVITENLYGRMDFIEAYGYIQVVLDKRECNNFAYIKDEDGFLHYASFYRDEDTRLFEYALRVKRLQDYAETKGAKVLFVVTPSKYDSRYTNFRTGMPVNDPNWIVDELLFDLNRLDVETLDLRYCVPNENITYEETFFKTDHHWTIPAAFYATSALVDQIEESFGEDLDPEDYYMNIDNYDIVTYSAGMLGSMGRKTGVHFSELEDFTALWPKFEGEFDRHYMASENAQLLHGHGTFQEVLMQPAVLLDHSDVYSDSWYSTYLNGLRVYEQIVNEENPDGCKVFMIRDSYFSPVICFLAPMCGQIDAMWSLEETDILDAEQYIRENEFDYIIIEVYPYNIESSAFNFFKE